MEGSESQLREFTPVPKPEKKEKKKPKRIRPKSKKLVKKDEVWRDVRQIVLVRDGFKCVAKISQYCSGKVMDMLTVS